MIDREPQKNKKGTLPAFTPVPRQCQRFDGWTPERQRGFIEALADLGSVRAAAHAVNMTPEGAYLLRRHPEAGEFRQAWEAALACGVQRLEDIAMDRALNGVEVPVYSYGKLIGTRRKYNDRLLMFLLRNRAGKRFAEGSMNLAEKGVLNRFRKQWRKQWEREQFELARERSQQAQAGIDDKIGEWLQKKTQAIARAMRADWLRLGGPPPLPGDDLEPPEEEAQYEEIAADADDADPEPGGEPAEQPTPAPACEEAEPYRTVSLKHGWPDDGRATPFYGRGR